jgi:hypothetical protein
MRDASENLARKKKDLDLRKREYDENLKRYNEIQTKVTIETVLLIF